MLIPMQNQEQLEHSMQNNTEYGKTKFMFYFFKQNSQQHNIQEQENISQQLKPRRVSNSNTHS